MQAIDVLMHEHRVIEQVLDALDSAANRLARGEAVPARFFLDAADFASGFADGCHHRKEEGVLFPTMKQHGAPPGGGAIEMMLDEHEQGRGYVRRLREAARQLDAGDKGAARRVIAAARGYAALLRDHIAKEDEMLFPLADELIPASEQADVVAAFEEVEEAERDAPSHEELLDLAERLTREAAALVSK
ncbi:MAG TPA: hemerythrin domain-containing protein [Gemmatimonadaceae bacterium]|nr:hemerythrin domain-containing protein [Gemmatimonadaceae bacterium]